MSIHSEKWNENDKRENTDEEAEEGNTSSDRSFQNNSDEETNFTEEYDSYVETLHKRKIQDFLIEQPGNRTPVKINREQWTDYMGRTNSKFDAKKTKGLIRIRC